MELTSTQWFDKALAFERGGDLASARQALADAVTAYPNDPRLSNRAGSLFSRSGDIASAEEYFTRAHSLDPSNVNFAIDLAYAQSSNGKHVSAQNTLGKFSESAAHSALYCSARGTIERAARNLSGAAHWYDLALSLEAKRPKALHGRARVAIERGETTALSFFERALAVNQGDADLWLGKAQALDVMGDTGAARELAEAIVQQIPQWTEGLKFLAQLRLAQGDADFTSHYGTAMKRVPQDAGVPAAWCATLSGLDFNTEAAEVAKTAQLAFPKLELFALLEAVNAGAAGDDARAEAIFARLELQDVDRWLHEARHRIRLREFGSAADLLDKVIETEPWSISAWALRGLVWRSTGDNRSQWLEGGDELVRLMPLRDASRLLPMVIPLLHKLHDNSPLPLGQSLRGGSQTRGILFDRTEPELAALQQAILATIEDYRESLPAADPSHPLLRHRDTQWSLEGSWSVRLNSQGDFHIAHIHPQGIVSSALYLELPDLDAQADLGGWLEIGRPPPDLRLDLEPVRQIEPRPGHLALFPSTQYHGTRPFSGKHRMTVAFDIGLRQS